MPSIEELKERLSTMEKDGKYGAILASILSIAIVGYILYIKIIDETIVALLLILITALTALHIAILKHEITTTLKELIETLEKKDQ